MKKVVLKVELYDDRIKKKAMKAVSGISGVESVNMDMKDKKLTLTGDIDPVIVVAKLKKLCRTEIDSVGPAKESDKKPEENKEKSGDDNVPDPLKLHETFGYYYQMRPPYYVTTVEEYPNNGCVIC